jgi:UDP-glucose 4-epimerase
MKILVTGGAGFIGNHLVDKLIKDGNKVIVLDNLDTSKFSNKDAEFFSGSILNEDLVADLIKRVDSVVHLAALVGVFNIVKHSLKGLQTNVLGSEIVIRNCAIRDKPLLLTSSSEIYGKNESDELDELSDRIIGVPQRNRWSYSDSKAIEEAFAIAYHKEHKLPVKIVRLFNTVGPGQSGEYGMVLPRLFNSALANRDVEIYGTGQQTRCFMHVEDAVAGINKFLTTEKFDGEIFNLGNPEEISIYELAVKIINITKSFSKITYKNQQEIYGENFEDMGRRIPNINKAIDLLGWYPKRSLDEILLDIKDYEMNKSG